MINGAPRNEHYPPGPELGRVAWSGTSLGLKRHGDELVVTLRTPPDFDPAKAETGTVQA